MLGHADTKTSHITQGLMAGEIVVKHNVLLLEREFNMAQAAARTPSGVNAGPSKP